MCPWLHSKYCFWHNIKSFTYMVWDKGTYSPTKLGSSSRCRHLQRSGERQPERPFSVMALKFSFWELLVGITLLTLRCQLKAVLLCWVLNGWLMVLLPLQVYCFCYAFTGMFTGFLNFVVVVGSCLKCLFLKTRINYFKQREISKTKYMSKEWYLAELCLVQNE